MKNFKWIGMLAIILVVAGLIYEFTIGGISNAGQFASGYFAAGDFAVGVFAAGTFSMGVFSAGIFSVGIFSASLFNLSLYGIGIFVAAYRKKSFTLQHGSNN